MTPDLVRALGDLDRAAGALAALEALEPPARARLTGSLARARRSLHTLAGWPSPADQSAGAHAVLRELVDELAALPEPLADHLAGSVRP